MTSRTPPHQPAASAPDLEAVVGHWRTDGQVLGADPLAVTGSDVYELLDGGHFLIHHVDVHVGGRPVRAIEIIGEHAPDSEDLLARSYDNAGAVEIMRLQMAGGIWRFRGTADVAPAAQATHQVPARGAVRSTLRISEDRQAMTALWERSDDGRQWHDWMHITFTRETQPLSPKITTTHQEARP